MWVKFRRPSPAMVIALAALFVALASPAWGAAIVPLAKRALTADKAKVAERAGTAKTADRALVAEKAKTAKSAERATVSETARVAASAKSADNAARLEGKTAVEVAALVQIPPVSSVAHLVSVRQAHWSIPRQGQADAVAPCAAGEKVVGGGWDNPGGPTFGFDSKPTANGAGWVVTVINPSNSVGAEGEVYAVCVK